MTDMSVTYDRLQVCRNGHAITWSADKNPQERRSFCPECGAPTIMNCPDCGARIKGRRYTGSMLMEQVRKKPVPGFCEACGKAYPWASPSPHVATMAPLERIQHLLSRFAAFARGLSRRHAGRAPLLIADEYDVQDVLCALLQIDFEDVRKEEPTPSQAGGSAGMDLLLKGEQVAIETKMARNDHTDKKLGDELLVDIGRYPTHSDCRTLIFFVFDPSHVVKNPVALKADLEKRSTPTLRILIEVWPR
jgi:REase_DpnII-MboI/Uncharacterized protein conserved in bacteria (DUF2321)